MGAFLAACLWLIQSLSLPTGAWAQRRRAEPEANPQFQQDVQGGGNQQGQPFDQGFGGQGGGQGGPALPGRAVQSVEIGAAPEARPAPALPSNPLDIRVSVRVKDAPLAVFLETISAQAKVNFLISEEVQQKKVTAFLQNVSVREALQMLLEIKGLTYQQIGKSSTYIIAPRSKAAVVRITRIYTLNYIPLIPVLDNQRGLGGGSSGGSSGGSTPFGSQGQAAGFSSTGGGAQPAGGGGSFPGGNAQVDSGIYIYNVIKSILTKEGQVAIDPRTNAIIVTDVPDVFPQIEQIISELDKKAPQVVIEAQIVEIDTDKTQNLGLEWGAADGTLASFQGPQRDTTLPLNLPNNLSKTRLFDPVGQIVSSIGGGSGAGSTTTGAGGTTTTSGVSATTSSLKTGIVRMDQLTIVLRALIQRSEARFLGKPKVLTMNNKQATIEISRDQALAINSGSISTTGSASQTTTQAERKQTGLKLRVVPQVNKEGYITLLVDPEYVDVIESAVSTPQNRIFDSIKRSTHTLVRIKNGQTLVLGGLLNSRETKLVRKVPFFGYIPLIGWLFTSTANTRDNSDLVIFLTPTIVND